MNPPSAKSARMTQNRQSNGTVVPHAPLWYHRVLAWVIFVSIRVVSITVRFSWRDHAGYLAAPNPGAAIYCTWHNRLFLSMVAYYGFIKIHTSTPGLTALVSASKDGGFLTAILERFRVQPVRGSSSRRGPQALLELTSWAERGYDLAITPDGPRGPRYQVQDGVTSLAQVTGLPIIPFSYYLGWKLQVKSWDRFQIPLPFSRCDLVIDKPLRVPRDASDEQREAIRAQLEEALLRISCD
jgi:lysophospholipid acyltransferase (LPLAT)-like uncharacterized protein